MCTDKLGKAFNYAYVRVSTREQNEERQIEALQKYDIDRWFIEKVSGKDTNRPQLKELLRQVRPGDTLYVHDFSRLARSMIDLLNIVQELNDKNVTLISLKDNLDTGSANGKLILQVMGAINEFERCNLLERQAEGIAIAKREGKFIKPQVKRIDEEEFSKLYKQYMSREITKKVFAERLHVSRPTLDKLLKDKGLNPKK